MIPEEAGTVPKFGKMGQHDSQRRPLVAMTLIYFLATSRSLSRSSSVSRTTYFFSMINPPWLIKVSFIPPNR